MIPLSRLQRKTADRAQGLELLVPWPADLPLPDLREDEERRATQAEWEAARRITGIPREGANAGLLIRGVKAIVQRRPTQMVDRGGEVLPHLAIELVTPRWYGATNRPAPVHSWWGPVR